MSVGMLPAAWKQGQNQAILVLRLGTAMDILISQAKMLLIQKKQDQ